MAIREYTFDVERISRIGRVFPDELDTDVWVMFHGTSGFNAASIEQHGFDPKYCPISAEQILRLVAVFDDMKWCGSDPGGFAVLKPFSLSHDFASNGSSLLFFAETSARALLYATKDFVGGEKLRAVRRSLNDLKEYLSNSNLRAAHMEYMRNQYRTLQDMNASPAHLEAVRPKDVDLHWLAGALAGLSELDTSATGAGMAAVDGAVYAIRMTPARTTSIRWHPSMGIEASVAIPASQIVGKVCVPFGYEYTPRGTPNEDRLTRLEQGLVHWLRLGTR